MIGSRLSRPQTSISCSQQHMRTAHRVAAGAPMRLHRRRAVACSAITNSDRLQQVLSAIDAVNLQDPRKTQWQGEELPYEYIYSRWLTEWVEKLEPSPSEELLIVARGQHIQRWTSPRNSYPDGRNGYLKWRSDLKRMHADTVAGLMQEAGYPEDSIQRVKRMINKLDLKTDPENQVVEDALCLVFLEHQFTELIEKKGADEMVDIVRKTWAKMGERGRAAALKLPLTPAEEDIIKRALSA